MVLLTLGMIERLMSFKTPIYNLWRKIVPKKPTVFLKGKKTLPHLQNQIDNQRIKKIKS